MSLRTATNAVVATDAAEEAVELFERASDDRAGLQRHGPLVAVVGLGYVGLPTALSFHGSGCPVIGIDTSESRRDQIAAREVDLLDSDHQRLRRALHDPHFQLCEGASALSDADVVVICVPTPVDRHLVPDTRALDAACDEVVRHARIGQIIILTSTSYVGTTRDLLITPLTARGFRVGRDIRVAFCPERIDPGQTDRCMEAVPRVVGGATLSCSVAASAALECISGTLHVVSSPEVAEMSKLVENTFRAVNIALANEFADVASSFGIDPSEVVTAAATKPFGFMAFHPGPGVGGHCIPCDPHYLLWQLRSSRVPTPVIEHAMTAISHRPMHVVSRVLEELARAGIPAKGACVTLVGVSYKPGVADIRESPALTIAAHLRRAGVHVGGWDAVVAPTAVFDEDGSPLIVEPDPPRGAVDIAVVLTVHPQADHDWLDEVPIVLDATYEFPGGGPGRIRL